MPVEYVSTLRIARLAEADVVEDLVRPLHRVHRWQPASSPQSATNDTASIPGMCRSDSGM
jgi:hypothetical protein